MAEPYIVSLSSEVVPLSAPTPQSQGRPVHGHTWRGRVQS